MIKFCYHSVPQTLKGSRSSYAYRVRAGSRKTLITTQLKAKIGDRTRVFPAIAIFRRTAKCNELGVVVTRTGMQSAPVHGPFDSLLAQWGAP